MENFKRLEEVSLKKHPEINEKKVQDFIINKPDILGLGNLKVIDKERIQPHAGRLDLLLQSEDDSTRYEVEIQLGKTDESHIIRTIEYWDIERNRYPFYDHVAVIVAEDVTSRFFNVISLFNKSIPLVAIQIKAVKVANDIALVFTTVLNLMPIGEDETLEKTDRDFWVKATSRQTMDFVDKLFNIIKDVANEYELNYNKSYIGLSKDGITNNFIIFKPQKQKVKMFLKTEENVEINKELDKLSISFEYEMQNRRYKIFITSNVDIEKNKDSIKKIMSFVYQDV